ncbi:hypothetical protein QQF64_025479 [Cirrhinus molitorella]|uniref:Coronin n=1 Tax=Cirrhinus molitorella TaxID=172907 RepID=A0ABR3NPW6_9TELE
MNRFKTSKYKNTTPKIPKKDGWISNVRGGSFSSQGNHIKSSCSLVAFNTDQAGGGMVGLSSLNAASDGKWTVTQISCHADLVTDLDFSPFDDYLLATCSADETVKLWRLCDPDQDQPSNAEVTLGPADGRLEIVLFHPSASGVLAVASAKGIQVWDVTRDAALTVLEQHADQLQGLAWKEDGSLLASSCKDKKLRLFDPRAQPSAVQTSLFCDHIQLAPQECRVRPPPHYHHIHSSAFNEPSRANPNKTQRDRPYNRPSVYSQHRQTPQTRSCADRNPCSRAQARSRPRH